MTYEKEAFLSDFVHTLALDYDVTPEEADIFQIHYTIAKLILGGLSTDIKKSRDAHNKKRRACYFSAEFLVGRAVYNNILCLGLTDTVNEAMKLCGKTLADFEEIEDAALGNGGLGRLAACFLDSAATLNLPLDGYGIRYKYGLFKQEFHDGFQVETADDWAIHGGAWSRRRDKDTVRVEFADQVVNAVPYDMPIMGYHTKNVGNLRLWQAESLTPFDFNLFNAQQYDNAVREKNRAEDISRVLYPNDDTWEGKVLRLKQQYFFCCASITDLLKDYQKYHGDNFLEFGKYFAVQLNDTHPVIAIPELVRQLTQYHDLDFEQALGVCHQVFGYTNHTIMSEALEKWPCDLMRSVVPQILDIIMQINNMLNDEMRYMKLTGEEIGRLQIVNDNMVHMARLAIYVSSYTNGVARIHTEIRAAGRADHRALLHGRAAALRLALRADVRLRHRAHRRHGRQLRAALRIFADQVAEQHSIPSSCSFARPARLSTAKLRHSGRFLRTSLHSTMPAPHSTNVSKPCSFRWRSVSFQRTGWLICCVSSSRTFSP